MNRDVFAKAKLIIKEIDEIAYKISLISLAFEKSYYRPGFAKTASGTNFAGIGIFQTDVDGRVCVVGENAYRIDEDIVEEAVKKMLARLEEKKAELEKEFAEL